VNGYRSFSLGGGNGSKCPEADLAVVACNGEVGWSAPGPNFPACDARGLKAVIYCYGRP